jgi:hypothetical protein
VSEDVKQRAQFSRTEKFEELLLARSEKRELKQKLLVENIPSILLTKDADVKALYGNVKVFNQPC